jgi:hypothetical protein
MGNIGCPVLFIFGNIGCPVLFILIPTIGSCVIMISFQYRNNVGRVQLFWPDLLEKGVEVFQRVCVAMGVRAHSPQPRTFLKFEGLKCHFLHSEHYIYLLNLFSQKLRKVIPVCYMVTRCIGA